MTLTSAQGNLPFSLGGTCPNPSTKEWFRGVFQSYETEGVSESAVWVSSFHSLWTGWTAAPNAIHIRGQLQSFSFLGLSITSQLLSDHILYVVTYIIAQPPWRKEPVVKMK